MGKRRRSRGERECDGEDKRVGERCEV